MTRTQAENCCLSGLRSQEQRVGLPELLEIECENPRKEQGAEGIDPKPVHNHPQITGYSPYGACIKKLTIITENSSKWEAGSMVKQVSQFL